MRLISAVSGVQVPAPPPPRTRCIRYDVASFAPRHLAESRGLVTSRPFATATIQGRRLGRSGPRGRGARSLASGHASCVATGNTGTSGSCGSLLGLIIANVTDGVLRLAINTPTPATHLTARPRSIFERIDWVEKSGERREPSAGCKSAVSLARSLHCRCRCNSEIAPAELRAAPLVAGSVLWGFSSQMKRADANTRGSEDVGRPVRDRTTSRGAGGASAD